MKRYIKSYNEDDWYDYLFNEHERDDNEYEEENDVLWEEFTFKDTIIPIEDGDVTDEGWDVLKNSSQYYDLSKSTVPIEINDFGTEIDIMDTGTVLEGIRDCLLDAIPDLPQDGKCFIKVNGTFILKFPFTYTEVYDPHSDEYEYWDVEIEYIPKCEIKDFSYEIL